MADRHERRTRHAAAALAAQLPLLVEPAASHGRGTLSHLIAAAEALTSAIGSPTRTTPMSLSQLLISWQDCTSQRSAAICQVAHGCNEAVLRERANSAVNAAHDSLSADQLPMSVTTFVGPARLDDFMAGLTISLGKLAQRCGAQLEAASRQQALRALALALEERYPGHTIELRVPPVTAVQLGAFGQGPSHHRGTPPNVVETDPDTFWALCLGQLAWDQARAEHQLRVSGAHADEVARMLPVIKH